MRIEQPTSNRCKEKIIRIFTKMKEMLLTHKDILLKPEQMEKLVIQNSEEIIIIFNALKQLLNPPEEPRKRIGFKKAEI